MWPIRNEPIGRATYATPKVANAATVAAESLPSGKKIVGEDQRGGGAVDREVVVLQRAADPRGERGLASVCGVVAVGLRGRHRCWPLFLTAMSRRAVSGSRERRSGPDHMASVCHFVAILRPCPTPPGRAPPRRRSPTWRRRRGSPPRPCRGRSPTRSRVNHVTREHVLAVAERARLRPQPGGAGARVRAHQHRRAAGPGHHQPLLRRGDQGSRARPPPRPG